MTLDYFYGQAGELFSFYRIPKALFQEPRFQSLSTDAKTLYGILLDRMSLSAKNGWLDEQGRVFIIFTIEDWLIQFSTKYHLSYMGAVSELLKQLDSLHSYDLLNQYAMKSLTIAPDNPKAYCWLIRSLKAQGMNELATNELAAAKEHLTTEEYEEILAFGADW